jgi:hypothetical protein
MTTKRGGYEYLTDEQAISFIKLMVGEMRAIAERRGFRTVLPGLASAEIHVTAMRGSKELPSQSGIR